jgi:drug/metabolite transporter (DMT)-like permease
MATVLGFGAEMQALRRLKPSIVSVLVALDPAVAFFVRVDVALHSTSDAGTGGTGLRGDREHRRHLRRGPREDLEAAR